MYLHTSACFIPHVSDLLLCELQHMCPSSLPVFQTLEQQAPHALGSLLASCGKYFTGNTVLTCLSAQIKCAFVLLDDGGDTNVLSGKNVIQSVMRGEKVALFPGFLLKSLKMSTLV